MSLIDAIMREWPTAQCVTSDEAIVRWDGPMPQPSAADLRRAVERHGRLVPAERMRAARRLLLDACDWTQIADSQLDEATRVQWKVYRQALRDIPKTQTDLTAIVWPTEPA